ncbi:MAG TPA: hypothetical protein VKV37_01305 [Ktedonobacteraceae bacterium]|nr:hypothetical protein [Ktedonobacteraceae bacterium]
MRDDLRPYTDRGNMQVRSMSRRRALHVMGAGAASIVGASALAACWPFPEPSKTGGGTITLTVTPQTTVTATTTMGASRPLVPYFLGYNNVPIHSPAWSDPNVMNAARQFMPGTLRYPGGTIGNYWDWQSGWFVRGQSLGATTHTRYRLQDLQQAVQATGALPIYVLNMLTSNLNTQLNMLRTAKGMGLPVKYVELGNEFYLGSPNDYETAFPSGADYGRVATQWAQAIHQEFPDAKVAAVGASPGGNARQNGWNQSMLPALHGLDAITFHPYVPLQDGLVSQNNVSGSVTSLDSTIYGRWQQFAGQIQTLPSGMKAWLTEYNLVDNSSENWSGPFQVFRNWIHGVVVAGMTLSYLEQNNVELVCFFDMVGRTGNEVVFYDPQGQNDPLPQYALTAAGWSLRLLGNTMHGMTSAQPISLSSPSSTVGGVAGWLFSNGTQRRAFIVNSSTENITWNVDQAFSPGKAQVMQLTGNPFRLVTGQDSLTIKKATLANQLVLPAYSVTQLML